MTCDLRTCTPAGPFAQYCAPIPSKCVHRVIYTRGIPQFQPCCAAASLWGVGPPSPCHSHHNPHMTQVTDTRRPIGMHRRRLFGRMAGGFSVPYAPVPRDSGSVRFSAWMCRGMELQRFACARPEPWRHIVTESARPLGLSRACPCATSCWSCGPVTASPV